MTTTRRSRRISSSSGSIVIEKEDFISGMLAALSNKEVIEKLQTVVVNDLRKEVAYLRCVIEKKDLTRFNKICHPSQRPRWQVDKEAIGLSRVQQCSSTYNPPS